MKQVHGAGAVGLRLHLCDQLNERSGRSWLQVLRRVNLKLRKRSPGSRNGISLLGIPRTAYYVQLFGRIWSLFLL